MARIKNDMVLGAGGKVGKDFVYKTREGKTFISKVPDMSHVVASEEQDKNRHLFAKAVQFAQEIMQDPVRREGFKGKEGKTLYNAAIKEYMRMHGKKLPKDFRSQIIAKRLTEMGLLDRHINAALFLMKAGRLTNDDCRQMNGVSKPTATRDLKTMTGKNILAPNGVKGAGSFYVKGSWWVEMGL